MLSQICSRNTFKQCLMIFLIANLLVGELVCDAKKTKKSKRKKLGSLLSKESKRGNKITTVGKNASTDALSSKLQSMVETTGKQQAMWTTIQGQIDDSFQMVVIIGGTTAFCITLALHIVTITLLVKADKSLSKKIDDI